MAKHLFLPAHAKLFSKHGRAVTHMHQQISARRFCLIFGAGAGYDLDFPQWQDFLNRLGEDLEGFDEANKKAENEISLAQLLVKLFEYDFNRTDSAPLLDDATLQKAHRARLTEAWRNRIHKVLYRDVKTDATGFLDQVCYYRSFLEVIKKSSVKKARSAFVEASTHL